MQLEIRARENAPRAGNVEAWKIRERREERRVRGREANGMLGHVYPDDVSRSASILFLSLHRNNGEQLVVQMEGSAPALEEIFFSRSVSAFLAWRLALTVISSQARISPATPSGSSKMS
jgi:hypothetical protein